MKKVLMIFVVFLFLVSCQSAENKDNKLKSDHEIILQDELDIALDKLNQFSYRTSEMYFNSDVEQNAAYSPLSLFYNLAMLRFVTKNNSYKEISDALSMNQSDIETIVKNYKNNKTFYGDEITEINGNQLETIKEGFFGLDNSVWLKDKLHINTTVLPNLINLFQAKVFKTDFSDKKSVEDYLQNFFGDLDIIMPEFDPGTLMVLMNLLCLKDVWSKGKLRSTEEYMFEGQRTKMLLGNYEDGRAFEGDRYKSFYITTKNGFKLSFILPKDEYNLNQVLNAKTIKEVVTAEHTISSGNTFYQTRCIFPAFQVSSSTSIKDLCQKLGIQTPFQSSLDFSIFQDMEAQISDIQQNIYIDVQQDGIAAGAITYTSIYGDSNMKKKEYEDFVVDRPFGFLITENETDIVLFSGVIQNINK